MNSLYIRSRVFHLAVKNSWSSFPLVLLAPRTRKNQPFFSEFSFRGTFPIKKNLIFCTKTKKVKFKNKSCRKWLIFCCFLLKSENNGPKAHVFWPYLNSSKSNIGIVTWTISNNFCFIIFPLRWIFLFLVLNIMIEKKNKI